MNPAFCDMHCHLDFAPNAAEVARMLDDAGGGAFAVRVTPSQPDDRPPSSRRPSLVRCGVGLHPWWVADGRLDDEDIEAAVAEIEGNVYVGEVGLDFGKRHGGSADRQRYAFDAVVSACASVGGRVLSVHAVRSADAVLDALEGRGVLDSCTCIFHWFSDSSTSFARAVRAGCYFSVGKAMLGTKRGREYARQIPLERLLLETDEPAQGMRYEFEAMQRQLAETLEVIADLRGLAPGGLAECVNATSRMLLDR